MRKKTMIPSSAKISYRTRIGRPGRIAELLANKSRLESMLRKALLDNNSAALMSIARLAKQRFPMFIEEKAALVHQFQKFATPLTFICEFEGQRFECYRNYQEKDDVVYALSLCKKNNLREKPFLLLCPTEDSIKSAREALQIFMTDQQELSIIKCRQYFFPAKGSSCLGPAHLGLNPCQLLAMVGHEGFHATAHNKGYSNIIADHELHESMAEAVSYLLIKEFGATQHHTLISKAEIDNHLREVSQIHKTTNKWADKFQQFYRSTNSNQDRTKLFAEMEAELKDIFTNPFYFEAFHELNNATLMVMRAYSRYFFQLLDFYEKCSNLADFIERVNENGVSCLE